MSEQTIAQLIDTMGEMQARLAHVVRAIHGTHSTIARVQAAIRKSPPRIDTMMPMDSFCGIPFVTHGSEHEAREAAWKQAVTDRCKVMLVDHDQYFEIDGLAMARMLDEQKIIPYVFGDFNQRLKLRPYL